MENPPNDVELIDNLRQLFLHPELDAVNGIFKVNLYGSDPDELTAAHKEQHENEWYFFTRRNRICAESDRPHRGAGKGFWSLVGDVRPIFGAGENNEQVRIGGRSTLVYYLGKDMRTEWRMKEYRLDGDDLPPDYRSAGTPTQFSEWCLCKLFKRTGRVGA